MVDLLSILRYPPKLKIEEKYADAPKNEDVYGDPLALPVDFDPDLLYPDVRRKESIANASDAPPVKESIDFQPFAAPASEIIKDPIISLSKHPVVEPTAEVTEPEPVKKVATSSNFETAEPDTTTSEPDETAVELIGDPVSEAPSPENQSIPVDNPIVDLKPESSESDLTDPDENDTSFLEDLYGI